MSVRVKDVIKLSAGRWYKKFGGANFQASLPKKIRRCPAGVSLVHSSGFPRRFTGRLAQASQDFEVRNR